MKTFSRSFVLACSFTSRHRARAFFFRSSRFCDGTKASFATPRGFFFSRRALPSHGLRVSARSETKSASEGAANDFVIAHSRRAGKPPLRFGQRERRVVVVVIVVIVVVVVVRSF